MPMQSKRETSAQKQQGEPGRSGEAGTFFPCCRKEREGMSGSRETEEGEELAHLQRERKEEGTLENGQNY